ncbi:uncharacterized protein LOC111388627 [Olea europaea var. sylvestris]|uniref:uncharacterized protein LOC111388627 n=1 Tax=Olea europaea var. sylvestris TaxID=158386 RepID=UPI000C1D60E5|nr:uncharacterized protein LOC111388627 [Olea europaea var. sylvestris]
MKYMSGTSSDHRPMTINLQKKYALYGPTPFRFQRMWCEHEGFLPLVEAAWRLGESGLMLGGLEKVMAKLKATKKALKLWNKELFGRVDNVILELEERVGALDSRLQAAFSNEAEQEYLSSKMELEEWQRREEIRLSQLAKKKWLSDSDNNSKFYHAVVSQRRRKSKLNQMKLTDGTIMSTPQQIHAEAVKYLQIVLTSEESEIILVQRMSVILSRIISQEQGAFIPGRSIFENITLTQELVNSLNKKVRGGNVMIKVDMAKAYDRVEWHFLLHVLSSFGFPMMFCKLIEQCISTPWFSVMMNGTMQGFFKSTRALRQGDPLSPYLFIIIQEVLTRLLKRGFEEGQIGCFSHPRGTTAITHLMYADDLIIFANGRKRSIRELRKGRLTARHLEPLVEKIRKKIAGLEGLGRNGVLEINFVNRWWRGIRVRKFEDVQRTLQMKFAWKLLSSDCLWATFFRAKYMKHGLIDVSNIRCIGSRFWCSIVGCIPDVINRNQWRIREGSISFWYAHWLDDGPLSWDASHIDQPTLRINDICLDSGWNMNQLLQLVGEDKAASVMAKVSKCREGDDVLIWKPNRKGTFSSKSAWDMIRVQQPQTSWGRWVWHSALPKRMSVIMWKAFSKALSVDSRVRQMGVALASRCDCCLTGNEEIPNHVLSTGEMANEVWRKGSVALGIRWRSKQNWYDRVNLWWAITG